MRYAVIAYPKLEATEQAWLDATMARFDRLEREAIAPHFTLVFPFAGVTEDVLVAHVWAVVQARDTFTVKLRCAMPFADVMSDNGNTYVFLVPDEGMSELVRLHDALYAGPLAAHLRLDVPFVPHITVGFAQDKAYCKQVADTINAELTEIVGEINALTVLRIGDEIETIAEFAL